MQQQLHQLFCAMRIISGQRVLGVSSSGERGDEPEARSSDAATCTVLMALAAQLAAGRIWAVRHGSSWLEAVPLPTVRARHSSVKCARFHCDPLERATREVRMICTSRMNRLKRIDMCTVVPYEYMSVGDVLNGLIYLILSSPTRVGAV